MIPLARPIVLLLENVELANIDPHFGIDYYSYIVYRYMRDG